MRCDVRARPRVSRRGPNRVKALGVELRSSRARLARPSADIAAHTSAAFERVEAALVGRGCYIPARAAVDAVVHLVAGQTWSLPGPPRIVLGCGVFSPANP